MDSRPQRPHRVPFALMAKVEFSCIRTIRVPEAQVPMLSEYGWKHIICDSDMADVSTEQDTEQDDQA